MGPVEQVEVRLLGPQAHPVGPVDHVVDEAHDGPTVTAAAVTGRTEETQVPGTTVPGTAAGGRWSGWSGR